MPRTLSELASSWSDISSELSANPRVLIVDDEPAISELLTSVVEHADYACETVDTGEAALSRLARARFHILLVDKNLPDISGLEVIERARELDKDCEAVVITGYPSLESVQRAINIRAADYLTKPFDSIDVVTAVLGRARRRRKRRVLARRMLGDLRGAVSELAQTETLGMLQQARQRVSNLSESLTQRRRVLVWKGEDDAIHAALAQLSEAGHHVWTASTGSEILGICSRRHVTVLIVSDHYGDLSGPDLVRQVTKTDGHPELVYVTRRDHFDDALAAVNSGAAGYFIKPLADARPLIHGVRRATEIQQEGMVHFKMITELYAILSALEAEPDAEEMRARLEGSLADFDVKSAQHAIRPLEEE